MHSARYAATDAACIERLLQELNAAGAHDHSSRSACFTAALALADPSGRVVLEVEGHCPGQILTERCGDGGFGYDPVFYVPDAKLTFAEMTNALKSELGHRGKALEAIKKEMTRLLSQGDVLM